MKTAKKTAKSMFKRIAGEDLNDEQYHKQLPLDEHSFSSSQVKTAGKNLFLFHKEAVLGDKASFSPVTLDAFTVGHYFHTFFLEPHKMEEYVTYEGRKAGKAWKDFQDENEGKKILSASMKAAADILVEGVRASHPSMSVLAIPFETEVSFFAKLMGVLVKCRYDLLHENVKFKDHEAALADITFLHTKADYKNLSIGGDLKSTSEANLDDEDTLRKIIKNYGYDVSFAFYKDIYEIVTNKKLDAWYWIIASKKLAKSKLVWADETYYQLGRSKYTKGMVAILDLMSDSWEYKDKAITLQPAGHEMTVVQRELTQEDDI